MALDPTLVKTINAYLNQTSAIDVRIQNFVTQQWGKLDSWRDADIKAFARVVSPVVEGAQFQIGSMTDGYLALLESAVTGSKVQPLGLSSDLFTTQSLRGVSALDVFQRPGLTIWTGLSEGKPLDMLVNKGLQRALSIASTNIQLASTHSSRAVLKTKQNVVGFRRVLSGGEDCDLCNIASTQRYHKDDLMPIHPRCDCKVAPIYGSSDPGQVIDSHKDTNSDAKVEVQEHGEIGPVLTFKGQHFTSL